MNERERAITNLMAVDLSGGSHEMLSSIAKAIYEPTFGWTIGACQVLRDTLVNLLSETDEEALREAYTKGREDGMGMANAKDAHAEYLRGKNDGYDEGYDVGFASADDWLARHEDAMAEHGWVKLPKDADGEYIHEHDKVGWRDHSGTWHKNALVVAVCSDGCYVMDGMVFHVHASDIRHYKQSTVEDVLLDCIANVCRANHQLFEQGCYLTMHDVECETDEYIAEYAAKLRLAGDAE